MKEKSLDRHVEPETTIFHVRVPISDLEQLGRLAKMGDQTKGAVIRTAIRFYLEACEQ